MESPTEHVLRIVRETLDSIVSPAVRDTLIAEAMELGKRTELPDDARSFREFVAGPLSQTLERALGERLGPAVAAELESLAEQIPRKVDTANPTPRREKSGRAARDRSRPPTTRVDTPRARWKEEGSTHPGAPALQDAERAKSPTVPARPLTSPRPPKSDDFPVGTARAFGMASPLPTREGVDGTIPYVFVVTRDPTFAKRFSAWLDPHATVARVASITELLLGVVNARARRIVIVFDAFTPVTRAAALAAVQEELPESARIVVWGGMLDRSPELTREFPRSRAWLLCSERTSLEEVVDCCGVRSA